MSVTVVRSDERLRATVVRSRALVDPRTGEHVGAASGAVLEGGRLFCVQDDALSGAWVDPVTLSIERVTLLEDGRRLPKSEKGDFEAVFEGGDGVIFALGSGGTAKRRRIVRYETRTGRVDAIDASALYEAIGARLPTAPNIEGAVLLGDVVRLFHRANGRGERQNASFDVALRALEAGGGGLEREALYDLGALGESAAGPAVSPYRKGEHHRETGVPLTFTDAARLGDGRVLYLAACEDCDDAIADGPVLGAAIGVIEGAEGGRYALLTEADGSPSRRKVEGVALAPGEREAFVVTDPDDPERPSELCTVLLEGPW